MLWAFLYGLIFLPPPPPLPALLPSPSLTKKKLKIAEQGWARKTRHSGGSLRETPVPGRGEPAITCVASSSKKLWNLAGNVPHLLYDWQTFEEFGVAIGTHDPGFSDLSQLIHLFVSKRKAAQTLYKACWEKAYRRFFKSETRMNAGNQPAGFDNAPPLVSPQETGRKPSRRSDRKPGLISLNTLRKISNNIQICLQITLIIIKITHFLSCHFWKN